MSLTKVTYSMIDSAPTNVLDYGADPTGVTSSDAAFIRAQNANANILVPTGTFLLDNYRPKSGEVWHCAGYENTIIQQANAARPAIRVLSDVTTGFLSSISLTGFKVKGAASATVAAVIVEAYTTYVVWKSVFDFVAKNTYRALEVQGIDANNVFQCQFKVSSETTSNTAYYVNGGTYNTFDFTAGLCSGKFVYFNGLENIVTRCAGSGQIKIEGTSNLFLNPTVEEIEASALGEPAIYVNGGNITLINPTVILSASAAAKVTYAFQTFTDTVLINPRIFASTLANPFAATNAYSFTVVGGSSNTINKIETTYSDFSDPNQNVRRVSFVGDCSTFTSGQAPLKSGKTIQYLAPTTTFNFQVLGNTDVVVWEPTGTIAQCNLILPAFPKDNQSLTFSSTQTVTFLNISTAYAPSDNVSLVPTTIAANTSFTVIYRAANTKWYRI